MSNQLFERAVELIAKYRSYFFLPEGFAIEMLRKPDSKLGVKGMLMKVSVNSQLQMISKMIEQGAIKEKRKDAWDINRISINIVNQLFDLAEVPVEKRQAINDKADDFVFVMLLHSFL